MNVALEPLPVAVPFAASIINLAAFSATWNGDDEQAKIYCNKRGTDHIHKCRNKVSWDDWPYTHVDNPEIRNAEDVEVAIEYSGIVCGVGCKQQFRAICDVSRWHTIGSPHFGCTAGMVSYIAHISEVLHSQNVCCRLPTENVLINVLLDLLVRREIRAREYLLFQDGGHESVLNDRPCTLDTVSQCRDIGRSARCLEA